MSDYVLVVDDNPDVQKLVLDVLRLSGVEAQKANNGRQALDLVQADPPAAIVLDLLMPIMDGFNTLAQLQGDKKSRSIPVILMSALAEPDSRISRLPGVVGVIEKGNFTVDGLLGLLSKAGVAVAH